MDILNQLLFGFGVALQPMNLLYCFFGVLIGTLIGVLPGVGPAAALSLLLPVTFYVPPVSTIILLAGITYGAMYGGSTTSILVNIPGEAASVVTCLDGYQMARKGRAGAALGIAAFGSFIAGTITIFMLIFLAPTLANAALKFGPAEYFALMVLGLEHHGLPGPGFHRQRPDHGLLRPGPRNHRDRPDDGRTTIRVQDQHPHGWGRTHPGCHRPFRRF